MCLFVEQKRFSADCDTYSDHEQNVQFYWNVIQSYSIISESIFWNKNAHMVRSMAEIQLKTRLESILQNIRRFGCCNFLSDGLDIVFFFQIFIFLSRKVAIINTQIICYEKKFIFCVNISDIQWDRNEKWLKIIEEIQYSSNNCNATINNKIQNVVKSRKEA